MNIVDLKEELDAIIKDLEVDILDDDEFEEFEENISNGGNRSDTLSSGIDYGHTLGELKAYKHALTLIDETLS